MNNPAFLVDGQTEQRSISRLCPGHPVRTINCNGRDVSLEAIAERLATLIRALNNRHYPIIVLVDKEGRNETTTQIRARLTDLLKAAGVNDNVLIGVCNRMIENWILSDIENFKSYVGAKAIKKDVSEGCSGKAVVKSIFKEYHETSDGVELLCSSNPQIMFDNSPSFREFVLLLEDVNCNWLEGVG